MNKDKDDKPLKSAAAISRTMRTRAHTDKDPRVFDCVCKSAYQDERYGTGKRLHNPRKDDHWACTVCGRTIEL